MRPFVLLVLPLLLGADDKPKPKPKEPAQVLYAVPLAIKTGSTTKVVLRGLKMEDISAVKTSDAKVTVKLLGKGRKAAVPNNNYPAAKLGDTECDVELDVPKDFAGVTVELTATTPAGDSKAYKLTISKTLTLETEPNDGFGKAQKLTLPCTIDATIGKDRDVDVFRFDGKVKQAIHAELFATRLGSPAELRMTLYDTNFQALVEKEGTTALPDALLTFTLPREGTYYVVVQELNDLGGTGFGYRLALK